MGPTYYQRLRHMVDNKAHARARGPNQNLYRQPTEGKVHNGGLKFGEMEKDAAMMHGVSAVVRDRMIEQSDLFVTDVCQICGHIASSDAITKIKECTVCGHTDESKITTIEIPYGTKATLQYLIGINICPRILTVPKNC